MILSLYSSCHHFAAMAVQLQAVQCSTAREPTPCFFFQPTSCFFMFSVIFEKAVDV